MEASFASIAVLSADAGFALALTSPSVASEGVMHAAWVAVAGFALADFRISVVTFLTRFTVSTTEAGLASALPTDLKKRLHVLILFILI